MHTHTAALHLRAAAHHLAAVGDRATYWALLAQVERLVGFPDAAADAAVIAMAYATGELNFPDACFGA